MNETSACDYFDIRIICESTGIYHRRLLQLAGSLGMRTSLVHGEAVAKFRAIQFADHGKTDLRDPQAALSVAKVGRLIKHENDLTDQRDRDEGSHNHVEQGLNSSNRTRW